LVSAVCPTPPSPLIEQLAEGGRLIVPLERGTSQELVRLTKQGTEVTEQSLGAANFVPLKGRHGYRTPGQ
jgi:protein-L-isoaspartate(D-aspartate) O-methyltransferase